MRRFGGLFQAVICLLSAGIGASAAADECENAPDVLGTTRTLEIATAGGPTFGTYQYPETLALTHGEVVLTFDDGPHPRNTDRILAALKAHCAKATFFVVGRLAAAYPQVLRRIVKDGHSVGAHTWSHPSNLRRLSLSAAKAQIEAGFKAISDVTGQPPAPFLRFPGLNDSAALRKYAAHRSYAIISADVATDDWMGIGPRTIVRRTMARLRRLGHGIIIFHDTKAATAAALPSLLQALKDGGYKLVHIVGKPTSDHLTQANRLDAKAPKPSRHALGALGAN